MNVPTTGFVYTSPSCVRRSRSKKIYVPYLDLDSALSASLEIIYIFFPDYNFLGTIYNTRSVKVRGSSNK